MIRNVIFDLGNVVLKFDPMTYLIGKFGDGAVTGRVYRAIFRSREWVMLDEGVITEEEAVGNFCRRDPDISRYIRAAMDNWYELLTPIETTVEYIKELKKKGCGVYYLSNFHKAASESVLRRYAFFSLFDGGVFSFAEKLIKPDIRIYQRLLDKYGLKPEECAFIDDTPENVESGRKAGMCSFLFHSGCDMNDFIPVSFC